MRRRAACGRLRASTDRSLLAALLAAVAIIYIYYNHTMGGSHTISTVDTPGVLQRLTTELARPSSAGDVQALPRDVAIPAMGQTRALAVACARRLTGPSSPTSPPPVTVVLGVALMAARQGMPPALSAAGSEALVLAQIETLKATGLLSSRSTGKVYTKPRGPS